MATIMSVRERSVEVDGGVRAIAERLVQGLPTATHRHGVRVFYYVPIGRDESDRPGDDVRAVLAWGDGDDSHPLGLSSVELIQACELCLTPDHRRPVTNSLPAYLTPLEASSRGGSSRARPVGAERWVPVPARACGHRER